jgi:hypothetical protein
MDALALAFALALAAPAVAEASLPPPGVAAAKAALLKKHGKKQQARIERGVDQVASLWRTEDGDLVAFAEQHFVAEPAELDATFARLEATFEQLDGHMLEAVRTLREPTDLDRGPLLPVDELLAGYDPGAHMTEDLFGTKIGFVALLNFPLTTLDERLRAAAKMTRRDWAQQRLTGRVGRRVPGEVVQRAAEVSAKADLYIAEYNVWMHHVVDDAGARPFPSGKRLISHWNLRDELKAAYADQADGLKKQRLITSIMERIVTQTIPQVVIDDPHVDWNPVTNAVQRAPAAEIEKDAPPPPSSFDPAREPDRRYEHLLAQFRAQKAMDPYSPRQPNAVLRSFELQREMPEARVRALFQEVLTSPLVPKVAAEIERRLGRKLEPQDLWYDGFKARASIPEAELDALTKKKYRDAAAFAADMPRILRDLGFSPARAQYLSERIVVDPSRGAGHAMQAARRGDFPHLRTRVEKDGMNYKGYNIAVHELGHNVEQVFSLYDVDHTLLAGVPNSAFTEALAFVFQARDLELLGLSKPDPAADRDRVLNDFWSTWEIAGVALVDVAVWHWLYAHPDATATQLKDATVQIARDTWDRFYAPVLGGKGTTSLLGIYSHMIAYPLYLTDYPLGHLIALQIEEHLAKKGAGALGAEFERMAKTGNVAPDVWMKNATGEPVSAGPLLRATQRALAGK